MTQGAVALRVAGRDECVVIHAAGVIDEMQDRLPPIVDENVTGFWTYSTDRNAGVRHRHVALAAGKTQRPCVNDLVSQCVHDVDFVPRREAYGVARPAPHGGVPARSEGLLTLA